MGFLRRSSGFFRMDCSVSHSFSKTPCSLRPMWDSVICVCLSGSDVFRSCWTHWARIKTHIGTQWHMQGCSHCLSEWLSNIFSSLCRSHSLSFCCRIQIVLTSTPCVPTFPVLLHHLFFNMVFYHFLCPSLDYVPSNSSQTNSKEIKDQTTGIYLTICLYCIAMK